MILLFNYSYQVVNLAKHTTGARSILNLNNLRDLAESKSLKSSLLILWITDFALNLLYFYCCHCMNLLLTVKHFVHGDTALACYCVSITKL